MPAKKQTTQTQPVHNSHKRRDDASGIFVPAGLLLGIGIGGAFHQWAVGTLIGLGLGFLLMAIIKSIKH